jgi:hypothetical protein
MHLAILFVMLAGAATGAGAAVGALRPPDCFLHSTIRTTAGTQVWYEDPPNVGEGPQSPQYLWYQQPLARHTHSPHVSAGEVPGQQLP